MRETAELSVESTDNFVVSYNVMSLFLDNIINITRDKTVKSSKMVDTAQAGPSVPRLTST